MDTNLPGNMIGSLLKKSTLRPIFFGTLFKLEMEKFTKLMFDILPVDAAILHKTSPSEITTHCIFAFVMLTRSFECVGFEWDAVLICGDKKKIGEQTFPLSAENDAERGGQGEYRLK